MYFEDGVLVATNDLGSPYRPYKAIIEGKEITKIVFEKGSAKRRREYEPGLGKLLQ